MTRKRDDPKMGFFTDHDFQGNYMTELMRQGLEVQKTMKPGQIFRTTIRHDDWCKLLARTGPCNCNPEISTKPVEES